ncbi:MAG TPA: efflux RND transporter periplasmic adaptor subunit [Balneolaceae bacterium]|nr:efflux RND transporter periplasmic adaptor subunit [Balneolaceae bacterium]
MKKYFSHIIVLLIGISFLWTGCSTKSAKSNNPDGKTNKDSAKVRPVVTFATADGRPLYHYVKSQGVVKANRQIILKPKISGYVQTSHIIDGRRVHQGDTLITFQKKKWQYAVQEAKNEYAQAQSKYNIRNKMRKSDSSQVVPRDSAKQYDRMVRIVTGLAKAQVALKQAKLNLSYTTITAPFSGYLATNNRITGGTYVSAGTNLGQLVDISTVRVRFDVLESELNEVKAGMAVKVTSPSGQTLDGTVAAVSPVVDTKSKTGKITARVQNNGRLLHPGMTVDGRILVQKEKGKARIPRSAILSRDGGRKLVFKLDSKNDEVEWVYVHPKAENSQWAIVDNPKISPGDTLAVNNNFSLSHLEKVQPKMQVLQRQAAEAK